jgi:Helix-hairpin-helix motif
MKSVTVNRTSLLKVKEDTGREVVLICCVLFFFVQSILPVFSQEEKNTFNLMRCQYPHDSLLLVNVSGQTEGETTKENAVKHLAHFTPFFFQPVPLNSCDKNLLLSVPGIGPGLATAILETRNTIGSFHDMYDLLMVPGIGNSRMNKFSKFLSFEIAPLAN